MDYEKKIEAIKSRITSYPDFPKKGILFQDIFGALSDGPTCKILKEVLIEVVKKHFPDVEAIIGLESRGFLFAFTIAAELGVKFIPIRKKGKLAGELESCTYQLEYGTDTFEIQKCAIHKGLKCLIVDDLLATGGTIEAASNLLKKLHANILGCLVVIELYKLNGRSKLSDIQCESLFGFDY